MNIKPIENNIYSQTFRYNRHVSSYLKMPDMSSYDVVSFKGNNEQSHKNPITSIFKSIQDKFNDSKKHKQALKRIFEIKNDDGNSRFIHDAKSFTKLSTKHLEQLYEVANKRKPDGDFEQLSSRIVMLANVPEENFEIGLDLIQKRNKDGKYIYCTDTVRKLTSLSNDDLQTRLDIINYKDKNGHSRFSPEYQIDEFCNMPSEDLSKVFDFFFIFDKNGKFKFSLGDIFSLAKNADLGLDKVKTMFETLEIPYYNESMIFDTMYAFDEKKVANLKNLMKIFKDRKISTEYNFRVLVDIVDTLDNDEFERYKSLLNAKEFNEICEKNNSYAVHTALDNIFHIAQLPKEEYEKSLRVMSDFSTIDFGTIRFINELSPKEYDRAKVVSNDFGTADIRNLEYFMQLKPNEYENFKNVNQYLQEKSSVLQQHDMDVINNERISNIVCGKLGIKVLLSFGLDDVLKRAVELKYRGFMDFLNQSEQILNLPENMQEKLIKNLSKLSTPEQKLENLRIILPMISKVELGTLAKIINNIKSPAMTLAQKDLANKIFTSQKPYDEQIEEFIEKFDVPKNKKDIVRKYLKSAKLNDRILQPQSIEKQIEILEIKIKSIKNNSSMPLSIKQEKLETLENKIKDIKENPEQYKKPKINDYAMIPLAQQVEAHINLPNQRKEKRRMLNDLVYKIFKISVPNDLTDKIQYDATYFASLLGSGKHVDSDFAQSFTKLTNLLKTMVDSDSNLTDTMDMIAANYETHKLFNENGLDYNKWIKFDENFFHPFTVKVDVKSAVKSAAENLSDELNSPLAKALDTSETDKLKKILKEFPEMSSSAEKLAEVMKVIEEELGKNDYWKSNDANVKTFKDHIKIHKKNIQSLKNLKNTTEELRVRLWDNDDIGRNLFFGNHVGCCTAVGSFNSFAAPQHLMNSFINGIEIVDNAGNSYGNSMCYFAKVDDKLTFVIDSFEANGKLGAAPEVTDAIIEFSKQVCKRMGRPDAKIMFGPNYNKLNFRRCRLTKGHKIEIVGRCEDETYIDSTRDCVNKVVSGKNMYEI